MEKNHYCRRCGNCCKGMRWKKKFSFKKAISLAGGAETKEEIETAVKTHYKKYLRQIGLPVQKIHPLEWDKKKKKILAQADAGRCKHLAFVEDDKSICLKYEERPKECKDYICKKARQKMMIEKIKQSEKEAEKIFNSAGKSIYA